MDEHDFVFWILMAVQLARTELRQLLAMRTSERFSMYKGYREFAMKFAMEHFQIKKPRDKARREFRRWRMSPAGHSRARAIERFQEKAKRERDRAFNRKKCRMGQIVRILVVDACPRLVELQVLGFCMQKRDCNNLAKILRKAKFAEIRMRRPHSLTHGQLSQHCGFLPQNSRIVHSLQFSQAVQYRKIVSKAFTNSIVISANSFLIYYKYYIKNFFKSQFLAYNFI